MTRLTDGSRTIEIEMIEENCGNLFPDYSADFFGTGALPYDMEKDAYTVDDVEYCTDQAEDWKEFTGDYATDLENIPEGVHVHRTVIWNDVSDK